jgi:hypothetical protein
MRQSATSGLTSAVGVQVDELRAGSAIGGAPSDDGVAESSNG